MLKFVSYTKAPGLGNGYHDPFRSPTGSLDSPGQYLNAGIHAAGKTAFSFINAHATAGTFVFNVIAQGGDGGCGATLCLTPVVFNPMVAFDGEHEDFTDLVFSSGEKEANVVPIPAAAWLMLSSIIMLSIFNRFKFRQ